MSDDRSRAHVGIPVPLSVGDSPVGKRLPQNHDALPPLLWPVVDRPDACALYKAYPPHRGDDVPALLSLARHLPSNVEFIPLPPEEHFLADLRWILPSVLRSICPNQPASVQADMPTESASGARETRIRECLTKLLQEMLAETGICVDAEYALKHIKEREHGLYAVLRQTAIEMLRDRPVSIEDGNFGIARRDYFRSICHLPDHVPLLVIGRPDRMFGYYTPESPDGRPIPTDLRRILDSAGYPNRFVIEEVQEGHTTSGRNMRDRKTLHEITVPERRLADKEDGHVGLETDIGLVFMGRSSRGRPVVVASGTSSLGTYAAVTLLLSDRSGFREAVAAFREGRTRHVDIAFRCQFSPVSSPRPFRMPGLRNELKIEILNPDELTGYRCSHRLHRHFQPVLRAFEQSNGAIKDDCLEWSWGAPFETQGASQIVDVQVTSKRAYAVGKDHLVHPSEALDKVLNRIVDQIETDRERWQARLCKWEQGAANSIVSGIAADPNYHTFDPILLLGPPGSGKSWLVGLLARGWGGARLKGESKQVKPEELQGQLDAAIRHWPRGADSTVFSPVAYPETLLESALFGVRKGAFNDAQPRRGILLEAGSGICFLDELFELTPEVQARLLDALESGQMIPLGADVRQCFVCRVVGATNRAVSKAELLTLSETDDHRRHVRADLIGRFTHVYALPPLTERGMEIIPLMIDILQRERFGDPTVPCHLRMTRAALEVLVTYAYPNNVRDLREVVSELDDDLVDSFRQSYVPPDVPKDLAFKWAIHLSHLRSMRVAPNYADHDEDQVHFEEPNEDRIYQFSIAPVDQANVIDPRPRPRSRRSHNRQPADQPEIVTTLSKRSDDLQKCRTLAAAFRDNPTEAAFRSLLDSQEFRESLEQVTLAILEAHLKSGFTDKSLREYLPNCLIEAKMTPIMPFWIEDKEKGQALQRIAPDCAALLDNYLSEGPLKGEQAMQLRRKYGKPGKATLHKFHAFNVLCGKCLLSH